VKYPTVDSRDALLLQLCREVACICISEEFQRLNKEMLKLYRKSGVPDPHLVAFQDTLFSIFLESNPLSEGSLEPHY
jgi:hypothetical protein